MKSLKIDELNKIFGGDFSLDNDILSGNFEDVPEITIEKLEDLGFKIHYLDRNGYDAETLQTIWDNAIDAFPHKLDPTSIEQGDPPENYDPQDPDDIEYSVEYTFDAGNLCNLNIVAGGWIEFRYDPNHDTEPTIYAWFGLAINGEWKNPEAKIGGEFDAAQTCYDIEKQEWDPVEISSM
jgi:hypothetical protein